MNIGHVILYYIVPALDRLAYDDRTHTQLLKPSAVQLVTMTAAVESEFEKVEQDGVGEALSLWQQEEPSAQDIYNIMFKPKYSKYRKYERNLQALMIPAFEGNIRLNLLSNQIYAAAMCRLQYLRQKELLPQLNDVEGHYKYYKKHWNSYKGATTRQKFRDTWHRFRIDKIDFPAKIQEGLSLLKEAEVRHKI